MEIFSVIKNLFWWSPTNASEIKTSVTDLPAEQISSSPAIRKKHKKRSVPKSKKKSLKKKPHIRDRMRKNKIDYDDSNERLRLSLDNKRFSKYLEIQTIKNPKLQPKELKAASKAEWSKMKASEKSRYDLGGMYWDLSKIKFISEENINKKIKENKKKENNKKKLRKPTKRNRRKK